MYSLQEILICSDRPQCFVSASESVFQIRIQPLVTTEYECTLRHNLFKKITYLLTTIQSISHLVALVYGLLILPGPDLNGGNVEDTGHLHIPHPATQPSPAIHRAPPPPSPCHTTLTSYTYTQGTSTLTLPYHHPPATCLHLLDNYIKL